MKRFAEIALPILLVVIALIVGARHLPGLGIKEIRIEGVIPETAGIERALHRAYGENRFLVSTRSLEKALEELPYVLESDVRRRKDTLTVSIEPRKGMLLIGAERELFTDGENVWRLGKGDAKTLSSVYFPLSLERGRAAYIEEFGLGPEFQRVTGLMLELSGGLCYNVKLMSSGSWTASEGPGFGTLKIVSDALGTSLIIREELSAEFLRSLFLRLEEKGPSEGFRPQTYEIKDNTLKMRKEG